MSDHFWSVGSPLSCLPLCMINRIICISASPWTTVLPSRVSALHTAPPSALRTGLGKPRWDVLAFRHHPLQEGRGRWEEGLWVFPPPPSRHKAEKWSLCQAAAPLQGWQRVRGWGDKASRGTFACPQFQFPSGLSAEMTTIVTSKKNTPTFNQRCWFEYL